MSKLVQAKSYLNYLLKAKNRNGVHSPFVYALLDSVIYNTSINPPAFREIETLRKELEGRTDTIEITDLGAGSTVNTSKTRKVGDIARNSSKPPRLAELIYKLAKKFQPGTIVELGTSLGISTSYLSHACPNSKVYTIEGCPETAKIAEANFEKLGLKNVALRVGNFDNKLPELIKEVEQLDLVFIDGNHRKDPTVDYFNQCLEKADEDSIFIFDDIHWSTGMEEAWEAVKKHPRVTVTLDLYYIGIVFLRNNQAKEDFVIRL